MTFQDWEPLSKTRSLKEHDRSKLLTSMTPLLQQVEAQLCADWAEMSGKPAAVAKAAVLATQNELVVPLIDEINELRRLAYGGLAGRLVRMIKEAENVAVHSCGEPGHADAHMAKQTCGACILQRIGAEVWVRPVLGTL